MFHTKITLFKPLKLIAVIIKKVICLHLQLVKERIPPKLRNTVAVSPLTCSAVHQSGLFRCELPSFGDID